MTEDDRFDWSVAIVTGVSCAVVCIGCLIATLCVNVRVMRKVAETEAHIEDVQARNDELAERMRVQSDVFACIARDMRGEW